MNFGVDVPKTCKCTLLQTFTLNCVVRLHLFFCIVHWIEMIPLMHPGPRTPWGGSIATGFIYDAVRCPSLQKTIMKREYQQRPLMREKSDHLRQTICPLKLNNKTRKNNANMSFFLCCAIITKLYVPLTQKGQIQHFNNIHMVILHVQEYCIC